MLTSQIVKRSHTSLARGVTIDGYLSGDEVKKLYEKWSPEWEEPFEVQGGEVYVTCEQVREIPLGQLTSVYGKKFASKLTLVANKFAQL